MKYDYLTDGAEIYRQSFAIIRAESDLARFSPDEERVAVRMIHASGATDLADEIDFSPGVCEAATTALRGGAPILVDTNMVASGISWHRLPADNEIVCLLSEPETAEHAKARGITRTAAAVDRWGERIDGAVIAIGNAPTALFHLLELLHDKPWRPAAVLGMPVGFVGAAESKDALADNALGVEYAVVRGRRGGSAITCGALNALTLPTD